VAAAAYLDVGEECDDGALNGASHSKCSVHCRIVSSSPGADGDLDAVPDDGDRCPQTAQGAAIDALGCSLADFCGAVDLAAKAGTVTCKRSDWRNDEPLMAGRAADCQIDRGASHSKADDRCVPAS
jgi:hypothetical protein